MSFEKGVANSADVLSSLVRVIDDYLSLPKGSLDLINDYSVVEKLSENSEKRIYEFVNDVYCLLLAQFRDPGLVARIDSAVIDCSSDTPLVLQSLSLVADDVHRVFPSVEDTVRYEHKLLPLASRVLFGAKSFLESSVDLSGLHDYFYSQKKFFSSQGFYRLNLLPGVAFKDQVPVVSSSGFVFYRFSDSEVSDSSVWPYH